MNCSILKHKEAILNAKETLVEKELISPSWKVLSPAFLSTVKELSSQAKKNYGVDEGPLFTQERKTSKIAEDYIQAIPNVKAFSAIDEKRKQLGIYDNKQSLGAFNRGEQAQKETISDVVRPSAAQAHYISILDNLAKKFNIPWQQDDAQSTLGRFENGTVIINMSKIALDTPFHEYAHPFEQILKVRNYNLWSSLGQRASSFTYKGKNLSTFVSEKYPELSKEDQISEIIVTAIGLSSVDPTGFKETDTQTWLQKFLNAIKQLFGKQLDSLSKDTTILQLSKLMRISKTISTEGIVLGNAEQKASNIPPSSRGEGIKKLKELNKDVVLDDSDTTKTFYRKGALVLARATEWVSDNFSSKEKGEKLSKSSPAQWRAKRYYYSRNKNTADEIIWEETGKTVTFDELTAIMQHSIDKDRRKGSLLHAIIESYINPSQELLKKVNDLMAEVGEPAWKYKWLSSTKILNTLVNDLNLQVGESFKGTEDEDKLTSELKIASEILNVGTTIDLLAEHSSGAFSIYDFKTGAGFLNDQSSPENMRFGALIDDLIKDNKLNKGKMEIVLRALMIKEQFPEARFRDFAIVNIGNNMPTGVYPISLKNYLLMLEEYFKTENPEQYALLNAKGLFNFNSYIAESRESEEILTLPEFKNKTIEEQSIVLASKIEQLRNKYTENGEEIPKNVNDTIVKYTKLLLELRRGSREDFLSDNMDMRSWTKYFETFYEASHPMVQKFLLFFQKRNYEALKEINRIKVKQGNFLAPIVKEWYDAHPGTSISNKIGVKSIKYHDPEGMNNPGFFDFMWEKKTVRDIEGWYGRNITEKQVQDGEFTQAQYEYNKWYRETLKDLYNGTMKQIAYDKITKEQVYGGLTYHDSFMPRIPILQDEVAERAGWGSKKNLGRPFKSFTDFFHTQQNQQVKNNSLGVPVKYMGNKTIISQEEADISYSFSTEEMLNLFSQNMIYKKYLDESYALGKGVMQVFRKDFRDPVTKTPIHKNTIDWLDHYLEGNVANKKEEILLTRSQKTHKNPITGKSFNVNYSRVLESQNSLVTASTMWLSPISGGFNTLITAIFNSKEAIKGSIAEMNGMNADYTLADLAKGAKEWFSSGLLGKAKDLKENTRDFERNDKMHRFIDLLNFSTDTFRGRGAKTELMTAKNRLLNKSMLYLFHSIGEEFGNYSAMIAMLSHKKITNEKGEWIKIENDGTFSATTEKEATSFWDAYSITPLGEFIYNGPQRGITPLGEKIFGLTSEEMNKMRRITQRIYGGYREDEKVAIEQYLLGRWIMKFKKYLSNIIAYNFQDKFEDWSLGQYGQLYDEQGNAVFKDGQRVLEWQKAVNEGRINVFIKFFTYSIASRFKEDEKFKEYQWENLKPEQKKMMIDLGLSMFFYFSMLIAGKWYWGDEDEEVLRKNQWYNRFSRLKEDMLQVHPMDLLRQSSSPLLQTQQTYKMFDAGKRFLWDGAIMGDRLQTGPNKGNLPGSTYLTKKIPIINIGHQFGAFSGGEDELDTSYLDKLINKR